MKLSYLRNTTIPEGFFGDLIKISGTSLPHKLQSSTYVDRNPALRQIVNSAVDLDVSLLDAKQSAGWWRKLFDIANIKRTSRIALMDKIIGEIKPRIDTKAEDRAAYLQQMLAQHLRGQAPRRRRTWHESVMTEAGLLQRVAALFKKTPPPSSLANKASKDWLRIFVDRLAAGKQLTPRMVRQANNYRVAVAAINMVADHLIEQGADSQDPFRKQPKQPKQPKQSDTRRYYAQIKHSAQSLLGPEADRFLQAVVNNIGKRLTAWQPELDQNVDDWVESKYWDWTGRGIL